MATLYTHQDANVRKTWFLMAMFLVVVVFIGYFIGFYYKNMIITYIAFGFSLLMNIFSYWKSDKIALSISRARPVTREEFPDYYRSVENLAITAGLPLPNLYVIDDQAPNAFATGRDKDHASIAVTTGLLSIMDKNELDGVIAHELAHIGNRDILLQTIVIVLLGFVSILADFFLRGVGGRRSRDNNGGGLLMIIGIVFVILSPIITQLIHLAISRKREFLADASGALLTRYPQGLVSALKKIGSYSSPMENVHNATAHLFISSPFGNNSLKKVSRLFSTHPPIEDRIKALINV